MNARNQSLIPSGERTSTYYSLAGVVFSATVIGLSIWLTPAEKGFGTHTQLGLPRCSFQMMTGVPGPSCGMTTSFAHMSSGNLTEALRSNLFGVFVYVLILISGLESLMHLLSVNFSFLAAIANHINFRHLFVAATFWLLSWILKLHVIAGTI